MKRFHVVVMVIVSIVFLGMAGNAAAYDEMQLTSMFARQVGEPTITFDFIFDGSILGNSAIATGYITFDSALLLNPSNQPYGDEYGIGDPEILDLSVMVAGADAGNGLFGLSDFESVVFGTGGVALDFSQELVGQPTLNDPWGTPSDGLGGDFNLFKDFSASSLAPEGVWYFTLAAGYEEPIPEPATMLLLGLGLIGLAGARRKLQG